MSKTKSSFFCQHCGHESAKWLGKCPSCAQWNCFVEELITKGNDKNSKDEWKEYNGTSKIKTIALKNILRISQYLGEWNQ